MSILQTGDPDFTRLEDIVQAVQDLTPCDMVPIQAPLPSGMICQPAEDSDSQKDDIEGEFIRMTDTKDGLK